MSRIAKILSHDDPNISSDYCLISYQKFIDADKSNPIINLLCGHCFLYDNILQSYIILNNVRNTLNCRRMCPYCCKYGGYLPYIKPPYIRGTHYRLKAVSSSLNTHQCSGIIKSGKNKGKRCTSIARYNKYTNGIQIHFCGRHKRI